MTEETSQIPACQRCRLRKIRCDHAAPKCAGCAKASVACIIIDPFTQKQYTREYIHELEQKEKRLSRDSHSVHDSVRSEPEPQQSQAQENVSPTDAPSAGSGTTFGGFVGESSGLNLLQSVFAGADFRAGRGLRHAGPRPQAPELAVSAAELPSSDEAVALVENYFSRFHINHTFLVREDVLEVYNKVYHPQRDYQCSSQDHFRLFMICAISGITRYRAGQSKEHPFGYYLAALKHVEFIPLIGTSDAIVNSLLVARFGMYHSIGASLWDISQFCIRQCVELGYHAGPRRHIAAIEEQKQRRIFWECYILNRYSSGILGRPFAIADEDISVQLPILADDEALKAANIVSLSDLGEVAPSEPTEVSVFVFLIQLRRISSRIHTEFYSGRRHASRSGHGTPTPFTSAGHVQMKVHNFLSELEDWRRSAPVFQVPRSLYERPEWYEFLKEKDQLTLIRGAMQVAPKLSNKSPPSDLLALALQSATAVITLYSGMLEKQYITWTRSYFQGIFAAGLSVLFCLSINPEVAQNPATSTEAHPLMALQTCSQVLQTFEKEMPDVWTFATVFNELKDSILTRLQDLDRRQPTEQIPHGPSNTNVDESLNWASSSIDPVRSHAGNDAVDMQPTTAFDMSLAQFGGLGLSQDGTEWPVLTEEFMESLEAGLGEYAWGFTGDDWCQWNQLAHA